MEINTDRKKENKDAKARICPIAMNSAPSGGLKCPAHPHRCDLHLTHTHCNKCNKRKMMCSAPIPYYIHTYMRTVYIMYL